MASKSRDALDRAREAFQGGDFASSLRHYEYFFDHALEDDPSFYGVRLSYCLDEWADLGEKFPPALERLRAKKLESLQSLEQTRDPQRFADYVAICEYLKCPDEAVERFVSYHETDRPVAESIVRFVWRRLVESARWSICKEYLEIPALSYEHMVFKLDEDLKICREDPSLGGDEFENHIKGWHVRDVSYLVRVLRNTAQEDKASALMATVERDLLVRGLSELLPQIQGRV